MKNDKDGLVIAIIPVRGGSKGIPKKNIKLLGGKPLIAHSIEAAKNSGAVDKVFVSTDSSEIGKIAERYGAEVVYEKEENKDQFNLATESYVRYAINEIEKQGIKIKEIILIQPTSPFTLPEDIKEAFKKYKEGKYDSILSACKSTGGFKCGSFLWNEKKESINYDYKNRKRRQELPKTYLENGAFYIFSRKGLKKYQNRLHGKIGFYAMPGSRSFEIDDPEDWEMAEFFIKKIKNSENMKKF